MALNIKKHKSLFFILLFSLLLIGLKALAMELTWPMSPRGTVLSDNSTIGTLIQYLYEWGISLGILVAFGILVFAGIEYLTSAGDPGKMKSALSRIQNALLGIGLLLGSYLLLNTVNPNLTNFKDTGFDTENMPIAPRLSLSTVTNQAFSVEIFNATDFRSLFQSSSYVLEKSCLNVKIPLSNMFENEDMSIRFRDKNGNTIEQSPSNFRVVLYSSKTEGWWTFGTKDPCSKEIGEIASTQADVYGSLGLRGEVKEITCIELIGAAPEGDTSSEQCPYGTPSISVPQSETYSETEGSGAF